jgi:hypothetical protein
MRMAAKSVTGSSPVTFISEAASTGMQRQIPLSLIKYDETAASPVTIDHWSADPDLSLAQSIVADLIKRGILKTAS